MQGKLCTDQVQENAQVAEDQQMEDLSPQMESDDEPMEPNQKAEMTGAQVKQAEMAKAEEGLKPEKVNENEPEETKEEQLRDLISDYMQYLTDKKDL
jgi:midasin